MRDFASVVAPPAGTFTLSAPFDTEYAMLVESATTVERRDDVLILRSPAGVLRFVR